MGDAGKENADGNNDDPCSLDLFVSLFLLALLIFLSSPTTNWSPPSRSISYPLSLTHWMHTELSIMR